MHVRTIQEVCFVYAGVLLYYLCLLMGVDLRTDRNTNALPESKAFVLNYVSEYY